MATSAPQNLPDSPAPEIFYQAHRTFRSPKTILILLVALALTCMFWTATLHPRPGEALARNMATFFAIFFTFIVATGFKRVLAGDKLDAIISTDGVRYGKEFWTWGGIKKIGESRLSFSDKRALHVVLNDTNRMVILMVNAPLTPDHAASVLANLKSWLQQHHPEVAVD